MKPKMNINKENRDTQLKAHGQCSQNELAPFDSSKLLLILGLFSKIKDVQYNRFSVLKILVFSDYFLVGLLNKNKFRCPYYVL